MSALLVILLAAAAAVVGTYVLLYGVGLLLHCAGAACHAFVEVDDAFRELQRRPAERRAREEHEAAVRSGDPYRSR